MVPEMKTVPFQWLAIRVKAFHHLLLDRKCTGSILAAKEHHRRALDLAGGIVGMAWPDPGRLFVAHRRIVCDKGAHGRRRRDKMNAKPAAHAVTDHADARAIHFFS